ncbi:MAG: tRNA pseudouridine(38-40) synthase TruA [Cellulosilyticaceae bacterium]
MYNYKITLAYDGTKYIGWQRQVESPEKTIQGRIEKVLSVLFEESIQLSGSGRTDAGVHAKGQVANFHAKKLLPVEDVMTYLVTYLPKDIAILDVRLASERFHARYNATHKVYCYTLDTGLAVNPFTRKYTYHVPETLDIIAMQDAANHLIGKHDFKSFTSLKSKKKSTIRTISRIAVLKEGNLIKIHYEGDGFLQHMVRIISGTLIEVGNGTRTSISIPSLLEACDRSLAGPTAPPEGLCMEAVYYD